MRDHIVHLTPLFRLVPGASATSFLEAGPCAIREWILYGMRTLDAAGIVIRPATTADLEAVGRLGAILVRTHHDFDPKRFMAASARTERGYASFLGSQLREKDVILLVAEQHGEVVGYSYAAVEGRDYMSLRGPAGVLHDIVVAPEQRRHGVGSVLLDATLRALESRGVPQIVLSTAALNEGAKRLFARAGFRETMVEMTREVG
jgi:ribosomal protein S18 acetylase RimI-like enzyme